MNTHLPAQFPAPFPTRSRHPFPLVNNASTGPGASLSLAELLFAKTPAQIRVKSPWDADEPKAGATSACENEEATNGAGFDEACDEQAFLDEVDAALSDFDRRRERVTGRHVVPGFYSQTETRRGATSFFFKQETAAGGTIADLAPETIFAGENAGESAGESAGGAPRPGWKAPGERERQAFRSLWEATRVLTLDAATEADWLDEAEASIKSGRLDAILEAVAWSQPSFGLRGDLRQALIGRLYAAAPDSVEVQRLARQLCSPRREPLEAVRFASLRFLKERYTFGDREEREAVFAAMQRAADPEEERRDHPRGLAVRFFAAQLPADPRARRWVYETLLLQREPAEFARVILLESVGLWIDGDEASPQERSEGFYLLLSASQNPRETPYVRRQSARFIETLDPYRFPPGATTGGPPATSQADRGAFIADRPPVIR